MFTSANWRVTNAVYYLATCCGFVTICADILAIHALIQELNNARAKPIKDDCVIKGGAISSAISAVDE